MKSLRLLALATCCAAAIGAAGSAAACDSKNSASAASASAAMDCCATKGAKASKSSKVKASAASASAAMDCCMTKGAATTALASHKSANAASDCCMTKGASNAHASHASAKAGASCGMNAHASMAMDCSTCDDWAMCESKVQSTGARSQVVALKNGVMIVYTAEAPEGVRAVQAAVARRTEGMKNSLASRKADAKLCPDCKQMRGALASGKLHREVVNVEKGAMDLLTSTDKSIVAMIHNMTGAQIASR